MEEHLAQEIRAQGYGIFRGFLPQPTLETLELEFRSLIERHYTQENLLRHAIYPADRSETRESHAMMIAEGQSDLPSVDCKECPSIEGFLHWYHTILAELTGRPVAKSARSLLNWQEYRSGSKPVGEHFDGEYLRATKDDAVEFTLLEGILPRYVCVLTLKNENHGRGIELIKDGKVLPLLLEPGDLVLFDNIALRHRVPKLDKPRTTMGLRNFDHMALHFVRNKADRKENASYNPIAEGYVSEEVDCNARFHEFLRKEWPGMRDSYGAYV